MATWYQVRHDDGIISVELESGPPRYLWSFFSTETEAIGYVVRRAKERAQTAFEGWEAATDAREALREKYPDAPEWREPVIVRMAG